MIIEILDLLVLVLGIAGALLLIYKDKRGFIFFIVHSICLGIVAGVSGNLGTVLTCIFFIGVDIFGYLKWTKDEK